VYQSVHLWIAGVVHNDASWAATLISSPILVFGVPEPAGIAQPLDFFPLFAFP